MEIEEWKLITHFARTGRELKRILVREADGRLEDPKAWFQQPTAQEVSRLIFGSIRVRAQEKACNHFAHLLNRGSPLE